MATESTRIILVGAGGVGKTSILERYVSDTFTEEGEYSTKDENKQKAVKIDDKELLLDIWAVVDETQCYTTMRSEYLRKGMGYVCIYSITSISSFERIEDKIQQSYRLADDETFNKIIIVGNQCDLEAERQVSYEEGEKFAKEKKLLFFESSAKNNINIEQIFTTLVQVIQGTFTIPIEKKKCTIA